MTVIHISLLALLIHRMRIPATNAAAKCPDDSASTNGINVIIFFANSTNYSKSSKGMHQLKLDEVATVKDSVSTGYQHQHTCKEMLKNNVDRLVRFSQNTLGMKTGVVNISNKKTCEPLNQSEFEETQVTQQEKYENDPKKQKFPPRTYRIPNESIDDTIPSDSGFPGDEEDDVNSEDDLITSRSHKEVFRIRNKRETPVEQQQQPGEIPDVPLEKKGSNSWDVLDIMSHVRFSFFGNFFDQASHKPSSSNNLISGSGFKEDAGLYDAVCSTYEQLQLGGKGEFLLVVFGGHLPGVCDSKSALIQSVKHLLKSTDSGKTLMVVTGSCGDDDEGEVVHVGGNRDENCKVSQKNMPVFAKGPKHDKLSSSKYIYDIPMAVKRILAEVAPNFEEAAQKFKNKEIPENSHDACKTCIGAKNTYSWKMIFNGCVFISIYRYFL